MFKKANKLANKGVYITLAIVILIPGALLAFSLFGESIWGDGSAFLPFVRTETIYIIMALALLLPVALIPLIRMMVQRNQSLVLSGKLREIRLEEKKEEAAAAAQRAEETQNAAQIDAVEEIPEDISSEVTHDRSRFSMLTEIDARMESYETPAYDNTLTLADICEQFRAFSASKLGLYYDIADIRRFIAGLSVTHILIMQGMSGTGKTSLAYAFGEFLQNQSVIVPIQPCGRSEPTSSATTTNLPSDSTKPSCFGKCTRQIATTRSTSRFWTR